MIKEMQEEIQQVKQVQRKVFRSLEEKERKVLSLVPELESVNVTLAHLKNFIDAGEKLISSDMLDSLENLDYIKVCTIMYFYKYQPTSLSLQFTIYMDIPPIILTLIFLLV